MKKLVLNLINGGCSIEQVYTKLNVTKDEDKKQVQMIIKNLEEKGEIYYDEKLNIFKKMPSYLFVTSLLSNRKGRKYIEVSDTRVFIKTEDLNSAITFDRVLIKIAHGRYLVEKIIHRRNSNFVCELKREGGINKVSALDKDFNYDIRIDDVELNKLNDGDIFIIDASTKLIDNGINGTVENVICNKIDDNYSVKAMCYEYGFRVDFSNDTMKELESINSEFVKDDEKRKDLTHELIYTIDSEYTKDIDDAISIQYINDTYILKVHIANVSKYVKLDSALFKDALINTTSLYLPDTVVPMFPSKLSSGICSLNEGVNRYARTTEMHFNKKGELIDSKTYKSIIRSKKKMSYKAVNAILDNEYVPSGYEDFVVNLKLAYKLSLLLNKQKYKRGALTMFNDNTNSNGEVSNESVKAYELIENFMVTTNHVLTMLMPIAYRNHGSFSKEDLKTCLSRYKDLNIKFPKDDSLSTRATIIQIMNSLKTEEEKLVLSKILLSLFQKAEYATKNTGHFALALDSYSHTTSPIRRLVDYMNQVVMDMYEDGNPTIQKINRVNKVLNDICKVATIKQRYADIIEARMAMISQAKILEEKIGHEYNMIITEITPTYIKVASRKLLEGNIYIEDFTGDVVAYSAKGGLYSKEDNFRYKLGQEIRVKILRVNLSNGSVYYSMEENLSKSSKKILKKLK